MSSIENGMLQNQCLKWLMLHTISLSPYRFSKGYIIYYKPVKLVSTTTYKTKTPLCHCRASKLSISCHAILGSWVYRISRSLSICVLSSLFCNEKTCFFFVSFQRVVFWKLTAQEKSFQPNECGYKLSRLQATWQIFPYYL